MIEKLRKQIYSSKGELSFNEKAIIEKELSFAKSICQINGWPVEQLKYKNGGIVLEVKIVDIIN